MRSDPTLLLSPALSSLREEREKTSWTDSFNRTQRALRFHETMQLQMPKFESVRQIRSWPLARFNADDEECVEAA